MTDVITINGTKSTRQSVDKTALQNAVAQAGLSPRGTRLDVVCDYGVSDGEPTLSGVEIVVLAPPEKGRVLVSMMPYIENTLQQDQHQCVKVSDSELEDRLSSLVLGIVECVRRDVRAEAQLVQHRVHPLDDRREDVEVAGGVRVLG